MRCSLPALRSIWRLARLEREGCGSDRVSSGWLRELMGRRAVGALASGAGWTRGTEGGGGVDGRRGRRGAVVGGVARALGVELVGFHRRAAEGRHGVRAGARSEAPRVRKGDCRYDEPGALARALLKLVLRETGAAVVGSVDAMVSGWPRWGPASMAVASIDCGELAAGVAWEAVGKTCQWRPPRRAARH